MKLFAVFLLFGAIISNCFCNEIKNAVSKGTEKSENNTFGQNPLRSFRAIVIDSLKDASTCIGTLDGACLVDRVENALIETNRAFWDEADKSVVPTMAGKEEASKPSALMESINQFISEITDMFKDGLVGLFRDAKEDDGEDDEDDDLAEDDEEDDDKENSDKEDKSRKIEARGKKKKKKKAIIKLLLLGAVIAVKIKLLLKILAAHMQVKFLLIALASLLINALRLYFDLKKGNQPQKVIYYEHAQHQHHYDGGDDDWHSGWSRSYDEPEVKGSAQDIAYAQQKPDGVVYSRLDDKPNYSWNNEK